MTRDEAVVNTLVEMLQELECRLLTGRPVSVLGAQDSMAVRSECPAGNLNIVCKVDDRRGNCTVKIEWQET